MELAIGVQTALITAFLIRKYPRSSRMEEWKIGRLEEWKGGRVEGWKGGVGHGAFRQSFSVRVSNLALFRLIRDRSVRLIGELVK